MFRAFGQQRPATNHVDMTFGDAENWLSFDRCNYSLGHILIGDDETGPSIYLLRFAPDSILLPGQAHAHGSDAFKIAITGEFHAVPEVYKPGDFRLQQGWKTYPGNAGIAYGPEGGWEIVMMADRRGTRLRPAVGSQDDYPERAMESELARKFGIGGDMFSNDPASGAGPSAIASTLKEKLRRGRISGSFSESRDWVAVTPTTNITVALIGDKAKGPVIILAETQPGACAMPRSRFGTEALHVIIDGSCDIGGQRYAKGDMRIQNPDSWCEPMQALDDGLKEVIVLGDRRHLSARSDGPGWPAALAEIVTRLGDSLATPPLAA